MDPSKQSTKRNGHLGRRMSVDVLDNLRKIRSEIINSLATGKQIEPDEDGPKLPLLPPPINSHGGLRGLEKSVEDKVPAGILNHQAVASNSLRREYLSDNEDQERVLHPNEEIDGQDKLDAMQGAGKDGNQDAAEGVQTHMAIKHFQKWKCFAKLNTERRMSETLFNVPSSLQENLKRRKSMVFENYNYSPESKSSPGSEETRGLEKSVCYETPSGTLPMSRRDSKPSLALLTRVQNDSPIRPPDHVHACRRTSFPAIGKLQKDLPNSTPNTSALSRTSLKPQNHAFRYSSSSVPHGLPRLTKVTHPLQRKGESARAVSERVNSKLQRYLRESMSNYTTAKKLKLLHEFQSMEEKNIQDVD